jgi:inner membrane protein
MDSLTHLAFGACTGELLLGRKLGKKALIYGAIAANIPDVDIVAGFLAPADKAFVIHRGITHSIFFAIVFGLCLAWLVKKFHPAIAYKLLAFLFCFELLMHDLIDTCTSYGTGLLEPFSHHRFSIHLLYVADPLFTIGLLVAAIYLLFGVKRRRIWAISGLAITAFYLCFACICKASVDARVESSFTTPAPFTCLLWYCVLQTDSGYYTGYYSVFDKKAIKYTYYPQNEKLLKTPHPYLKTFADGYYTLSQANHITYFNVIRFGQIQGWQSKNAPFILSYPLKTAEDENLVIQKGRLKGWNKASLRQYLERIAGQ